MGLLLDRFRAHGAQPHPARTENSTSLETMLAAIARKVESRGGTALSAKESKVWNTAVVISFMSSDRRDHAPANAKVLSWAAARAGFEDMGLPTAAAFVTSLVTELAFRTEIDPRNRRREADSLVRLATLKRQFSSIEEQHDLWELLRKLIEPTAP
ncbi:hypothetical protein GGC65_000957 [Sphingopyxis sp. OAS728]|uniref:hypothetical protein n=1 Tax=Sphingopyxis sp. OAS728 TaxID=2663823 RepID=UPI0019F39191|nr:hypothetical protein [Sphingopyxis sp. OAS728]MBE1526501.1 hypothetical protein [Sphingopyxis sp. OAS728]